MSVDAFLLATLILAGIAGWIGLLFGAIYCYGEMREPWGTVAAVVLLFLFFVIPLTGIIESAHQDNVPAQVGDR